VEIIRDRGGDDSHRGGVLGEKRKKKKAGLPLGKREKRRILGLPLSRESRPHHRRVEKVWTSGKESSKKKRGKQSSVRTTEREKGTNGWRWGGGKA